MSFIKGNKMPPRSEEHRKKISERMLGNKINVGRKFSESRNKKLSKSKMGKKIGSFPKEVKEKRSKIFKLLWENEEYRKMQTLNRIKSNGNPETKKKIGAASRRLWETSEYREKVLRKTMEACHAKPNKAEAKLYSILQELYPNEWEFVGDGALIVGGRCPDRP